MHIIPIRSDTYSIRGREGGSPALQSYGLCKRVFLSSFRILVFWLYSWEWVVFLSSTFYGVCHYNDYNLFPYENRSTFCRCIAIANIEDQVRGLEGR